MKIDSVRGERAKYITLGVYVTCEYLDDASEPHGTVLMSHMPKVGEWINLAMQAGFYDWHMVVSVDDDLSCHAMPEDDYYRKQRRLNDE